VPSFQHYALFDESIDMLRGLMQLGFAVVPEVPILAQPELQRYETFSDEIVEKLRAHRCLLLEGDFTQQPLQFDRRDSGSAAGTYFVDVLAGQRIRWCLPGLNTTKRPTLTPGSIGHETKYRNPTTNEWEPASEQIKAAYKQMVESLKQHMARVAANTGERVWVGKQAAQAIEAGEVILER